MARPTFAAFTHYFATSEFTTTLAWFLAVVSLLLARADLLPPLAVIGMFLLSLTCILRLRRPFGYSHSTSLLLAQARHSAAGISHLIHNLPFQRQQAVQQRQRQWVAGGIGFAIAILYVLTIFWSTSNQTLQLFLDLLIPITFLIYAIWRRTVILQMIALCGVYTILLLSSEPLLSIYLAILLLLFLMRVAWVRRTWNLLLVGVVGSYWLATNQLGNFDSYILILTALYGVSALLLVLPRQAKEREAARSLLVVTYALALIILLQGYPALTPLLILFALICAGLAWKQQQAKSYAKYFFLLAVYLTITIFALELTPGWLVLIGLVAATCLLTLGITVKSYTLRLAGLATVAGSIAVYCAEVLPVSQNLAADPVLNRIGLGLSLAIILPLLVDWYSGLSLERIEQKMLHWIMPGAYLLSILLLFTLILMSTSDLRQSVYWLMLSIVAFGIALQRRRHLLIVLALSIFFGALLKLLIIDSMAEPLALHLGLWLGGVLLIGLLYLAWPRLSHGKWL